MKLMRMRKPRGFGGFGLGRWNGLEEEMDRLFNAPFAAFADVPEFNTGWTPALDLIENKDGFVATVELPGLKKNAIEVSFEGRRPDSQRGTQGRGAQEYGRRASD